MQAVSQSSRQAGRQARKRVGGYISRQVDGEGVAGGERERLA